MTVALIHPALIERRYRRLLLPKLRFWFRTRRRQRSRLLQSRMRTLHVFRAVKIAAAIGIPTIRKRRARADKRGQEQKREQFHSADDKTSLLDVDPFGVAQKKPCRKFPLRQGLWIEG
jgi:hypothetical protein